MPTPHKQLLLMQNAIKQSKHKNAAMKKHRSRMVGLLDHYIHTAFRLAYCIPIEL